MLLVAKRYTKEQVTVRVSPEALKKLRAVGDRLMRNTSEMFDRAIEFYLREGAAGDIAEIQQAKSALDSLLSDDKPTRR